MSDSSTTIFCRYKYRIALTLIIVVAAFLRFYKLNFQSLWYDELFTMNQCDPSLSWKAFFDQFLIDYHPPGFFVMQRLMLTAFGYEEATARILPALAGTLCIPAIYMLGKEVLDKRLGLTAALLMTFAYFPIYFSQEARAYTLLCLFTILSFVYFLRLLRSYKVLNIVMLALCNALMLYMHFFSVFTILSQLLIIFILWLNETGNKRKLLFSFFIAMLFALLLYIPCLPYFIVNNNMEKYWITMLPPYYILNYYADFFGAYKPLYIPLIVLPLIYFFHVFKQRQEFRNIKKHPLALSFVIIGTTLTVTFGVAYVRSLLVTPMFQNRYFISTLPLFIIINAYALLLIKRKILAYAWGVTLTGLMIYFLFFVRHYYTEPTKEDMRSLTTYIAENGRYYPIVNEKSVWNQQFYLKKKGYKGLILRTVMNNTIDSIVKGQYPQYNLDTIWLEGGYADHRASPEKMKAFDSMYTKIKEQHYKDAWAELYIRNKAAQ